MERFKTKAVIVGAVQWHRPLRKLTDEEAKGKPDGNGVMISGPRCYCNVFNGQGGKTALVFEGDWVLTDSKGRKFVVPDEVFRDSYEPCRD